jgi:DNA-binding GntR family transcriptional regulator
MSAVTGSLTETAYLWIRDQILRGELPFGTGLSRRTLAEELGMSMIPVGDALQRLEEDGFVESRPRVGTRVRIPTEKSIRGNFVLREALETQAARIFAEKASELDRQEIRQFAAKLDAIYASANKEKEISRESLFEIHKLHMRFHMTISELTGQDELTRAIEKNQVLMFNWFYDTAFGNNFPAPDWHSVLAEALASGDPLIADTAMRHHTRFRLDELLQRMEPYLNWSESRLAAFPKRPRRKPVEEPEIQPEPDEAPETKLAF